MRKRRLKRRDWAVIFDLDGTLTRKIAGSLMRLVAIFGIDPAARSEADRIRDMYFGMLASGQMSDEQYLAWLLDEFNLYVKFRLRRKAWRSAIERVQLREGVVEIIRDLHDADIPVCVISAAAADFAEHVLETNGVLHMLDAVYAGRLVHDSDDVVTGWEEPSLVTVGNKGEWSRRFADLHGVAHGRILAVGDSPGDATIGHALENRVLIADAHEAEHLRSLGFAHEVFVADDFHPPAAWIRRRIGLPL